MSFYLNPNNYHQYTMSNESQQQKIQRIYIDPQRLIRLKQKRKPFKLVPSIFQPPEQQSFEYTSFQQSTNQQTANSLLYKHNSTTLLPSNHNPNQKLPHHITKSTNLPKTTLKLKDNIIKNESSSKQQPPYVKIKQLKQILQQNEISPNVQYIWKLMPSGCKKEIICYQEGDCIPVNLNSEDKFLVLTGEIRVIGNNQHSYKRKNGYLFFIAHQTKLKIKEIIALRSTKILKISYNIYSTYLKSFLYLKNSQKLKFLHYCPFFIWNNELSHELAACIQLKQTNKQELIYTSGSTQLNSIYFVKEGIVILERNIKVYNPIVMDYELHYEKNQFSQKDVILVVRKGMAFGVDGIMIKDYGENEISNENIKQFQNKEKSRRSSFKIHEKNQILNNEAQNIKVDQQSNVQNTQQINPEILHNDSVKNNQLLQPNLSNRVSFSSNCKINRKNSRIYTAKTLGTCQLYILDKKILQTLFSLNDITYQQTYKNKNKQISHEQLQRISIQYTNMIMRLTNNNILAENSHNNQIRIALKKKDIVLDNKEEKKLLIAEKERSKSLKLLKNQQFGNYQNSKTNGKRMGNDKKQQVSQQQDNVLKCTYNNSLMLKTKLKQKFSQPNLISNEGSNNPQNLREQSLQMLKFKDKYHKNSSLVYFEQLQQKQQLKHKIYTQRQKQKQNSIKKSKSTKNIITNSHRDSLNLLKQASIKNRSVSKFNPEDQAYTLPKLIMTKTNNKLENLNPISRVNIESNQQKQQLLSAKLNNNQKLKIQQIINLKINQQLKDYPNSQLSSIPSKGSFLPDKNIVKKIQVKQSSNSNNQLVFIKVKSYKSIITNYQNKY